MSIPLPWLESGADFPPTRLAMDDPNGLLAAGADLSVPTLLRAYRRGIFPWYSDGEPVLWWSPSPRTILWPHQLHVSRSLRREYHKPCWRITHNTHFADIIALCADTPRNGQDGTWITWEMQSAYIQLHKAGFARSIEVWKDDALVGGLYGVHIGTMFYGESMFSLASNASKIALVALCQRADVRLIDCQMETAHLHSMGARQMARNRFEKALALACNSTRHVSTGESA